MFLECSDLGVRYPGRARPAVDGATFGLEAGEIGVLIGPSGCGKTTLLRAVAGLEPVAAGGIRLEGRTVGAPGRNLPAEQRRIGMVFQDYALFPHLDVAANVGFGLHGWPRGERAARVAEVLALVGLAQAGGQHPHALSGGQQQRVALARALAPRPALLLLDEPFSNLDVDLRERLAHEVRAILRAAGATALFVTHDQLEAFAIGDRIGVMHEGRLHQWDTAPALYHRPATRFVADFIGQGVFAPATLKHTASGLVAHTPLGTLTGFAGGPAEGDCDMLLRAHDVVQDDAAPARAQVVRKAFRGSEYLYTLRMADGQPLLAHGPSQQDHPVGAWIGVRAAVQQLVTFPREARTEPAYSPAAAPPTGV